MNQIPTLEKIAAQDRVGLRDVLKRESHSLFDMVLYLKYCINNKFISGIVLLLQRCKKEGITPPLSVLEDCINLGIYFYDKELINLCLDYGCNDRDRYMRFAVMHNYKKLLPVFDLKIKNNKSLSLETCLKNLINEFSFYDNFYPKVKAGFLDSRDFSEKDFIPALIEGGHFESAQKYMNEYNSGRINLPKHFLEAIRSGNKELIDLFMAREIDLLGDVTNLSAEEGREDEALELLSLTEKNNMWIDIDRLFSIACEKGLTKLSQVCLEKGANDWNGALWGACKNGDRHMIDFLFKKGADHLNLALDGAVYNGDMDLINFIIEKGVDDWDSALNIAIKKGNIPLINFFKKKGAKFFDDLLEDAYRTKDLDIVKIVLEMPGVDHKSIRSLKFIEGDIHILEYLSERVSFSEKDLRIVMSDAIISWNIEMIDFLFSKGVRYSKKYLSCCKYLKHPNIMIDYLQRKNESLFFPEWEENDQ